MDNTFRKGTRQLLLLQVGEYDLMRDQALEGKNVKDMLLNVGSGGGAAAAVSGGGAAAGGDAGAPAPDAKEEEKPKEEGRNSFCAVS